MHVTKKYVDAIGGDAQVVAALSGQQRRGGHEVLVLTTRCPEIVDGPEIVKFGLPSRTENLDRIGPRRLLSLLSLVTTTRRLLRSWRPDVVHSHSPDLGFVITLLTRFSRIPVVHTCHGTGVGSHWVPAWKRRLETALLRGAGFAGISALSNTDAEALREAGLRHVAVIPNGVEVPADLPARGQDPDGPVRFLAVGRLEPQKAFDLLIEATAEVHRQRPGRVRLTVVGGGSLHGALLERVARLGLAGTVELPGRVSPAGMPGRYVGADAFVLSSRWEGLPLALLESWAHGLPAVATAVGAVPSVVRDGEDGLLVPPGDAPALAAAMLRLVDDPALRTRLRSNGRARAVQDFGWAGVAGRFEQFYRGVVPS